MVAIALCFSSLNCIVFCGYFSDWVIAFLWQVHNLWACFFFTIPVINQAIKNGKDDWFHCAF
jgi:hypothetical protein